MVRQHDLADALAESASRIERMEREDGLVEPEPLHQIHDNLSLTLSPTMMKRLQNTSAIATAALAVTSSPSLTTAFVSPSPPFSSCVVTTATASTHLRAQTDPTFAPPDTLGEGIGEELCADAARRMQRVMVPVPQDVSDGGAVGISYVHWPAEKNTGTLPLLLVHGFDSSALEYRRLGPRLAALGIDVYAVDLLGWGYTQLEGVRDFSAASKVAALRGFWEAVGGGGEVVVGGASLGGAATIEFAAANLAPAPGGGDGDGCVRGTVLIDAQGFVDGIGPMSFLPAPLARAGIKVLKSVPLRNSANKMSYFDPDTYATDDALQVGRLHCLRDGWEDGMLGFMQSGGFRPKERVAEIDVPSLILWGRQDGILDGGEFASKFVDTMPNARLQWVEECGHVPHLEQPEETAKCIAEFLRSEELRPSKGTSGGGILDGLFSFLN